MNEDGIVKQEFVPDPRGVGMVWVSTVQLLLDHGFGGPPKWYETAIFPANDDGTDHGYIVQTLIEWGTGASGYIDDGTGFRGLLPEFRLSDGTGAWVSNETDQ